MDKKPILILDLDETLINSEEVKKFDASRYREKMNKFEWEKMGNEYYVFKRPGLDKFFKFIFKHFDVSIWTAGSKNYALWIAEHVLHVGTKERPIKHIFFDYHCKCSEEMGHCKKDLTTLSNVFGLKDYDVDDMLIVDDNYEDVIDSQPESCIAVEKFMFMDKGSENDDGLKYVKKELKKFLEKRVS